MQILTSDCRAVVYVNAAAGSGRAKRHLNCVREVLAGRNVAAEFVETTSVEQLRDMAHEAIVRGSKVLLAIGGDGTAQGLVHAALGNDVVLGIIPGGGGNDFATALGLPANPETAMRLLLNGKLKRVDVAQVKSADGKERIYLGGGGIGLDVAAANLAATIYRNWPRKWRYVAAAVHAYGSFEPFRVRAEFPGTELPGIETEAMLAAVLNSPTYGAGLRFAPAARVDDGMLDMVVVEYLKLGAFLGLVPRALTTGEVETPKMRRIQAPRVRMTTDRQCLFHGDGEIIGSTPVEIEARREAVTVLVPEEKEEVQQRTRERATQSVNL